MLPRVRCPADVRVLSSKQHRYSPRAKVSGASAVTSQRLMHITRVGIVARARTASRAVECGRWRRLPNWRIPCVRESGRKTCSDDLPPCAVRCGRCLWTSSHRAHQYTLQTQSGAFYPLPLGRQTPSTRKWIDVDRFCVRIKLTCQNTDRVGHRNVVRVVDVDE